MLPSVVRILDNTTGPRSTTRLLSPPPSSSISNRKCRCVQHRHPERPRGVEGSLASLFSAPLILSTSNRKSGIRNPNNHRISKHFHSSNRKYSAIFHNESASHSSLVTSHCPSNRDTAIKSPNKPPHFNHFQFSNRDKTRLLYPEKRVRVSAVLSCLFASLLPCLLASSPCLRASVANLCDNGWLELRLL